MRAVWVPGEQYLCLQSMLDELSAFSLRQPNAHLRPSQRPKQGPAARRWWRYAIRATQKGAGAQALSWPKLHKVRGRLDYPGQPQNSCSVSEYSLPWKYKRSMQTAFTERTPDSDKQGDSSQGW